MTFLSILYTLLIKPLEIVFEVVYVLAYRKIEDPTLAIIALSLAVNFLALPLYRRADVIQAAERDKEESLSKWVTHIKANFKGDERFLMLQEYYRQNDYKPTHVVKGLLPLLLQIPFFTAAYRFLSNLSLIKGVSFGPIKDLGAPDAAFVIAGFTVNLLPIIMTLINFVSSAIYTRGYPLKNKLQLYGIAVVFLVLLYDRPAGLVFYWTLNNLFSLLKNIFYKLIKREDKVRKEQFEKGELKVKSLKDDLSGTKDGTGFVFFSAALFCALLVGVLIPGSVIKASPVEFTTVNHYKNPVHYLYESGLIAAGIFVVWIGIYYVLASTKAKKYIAAGVWAMGLVFIIDYMLFGTKFRNISSTLIYNDGFGFERKTVLINALLVILVAGLGVVLFKYLNVFVRVILTAGIIVTIIMSLMDMNAVKKSVNSAYRGGVESELLNVELSKDGQNVVVIMIDRAFNMYLPYIMKEKPELVEAFDGFTYYPNTISYGRTTNFSVPSLFGGYEYTPSEINRKSDQLIAEKHDEALKLMPTLFSENGYDVVVCDPPYAGYQMIPDLSIYDDIPNTKAYNTAGVFNEGLEAQLQRTEDIRMRNFFFYGLMKAAPVALQNLIYHDGRYNEAKAMSLKTETVTTDDEEKEDRGFVEEEVTSEQFLEEGSVSVATGVSSTFMNAYSVLNALPEVTEVDNNKGTLFLLQNTTTHSPTLLQKPDYEVSAHVDNTEYDYTYDEDDNLYTIDGVRMHMTDSWKIEHYHANMAAIMALGRWMDYLREEGVYDNTRIIICSDHGLYMKQFDNAIMDGVYMVNEDEVFDIMSFNPLFLVKDFNSKGFTTSDEFMTLADIPTIAMEGIIENPVNPFTGLEVNNNEKYAHPQEITYSDEYRIDVNNGYKFIDDGKGWYSVHDNILDASNWEYIGTK